MSYGRATDRNVGLAVASNFPWLRQSHEPSFATLIALRGNAGIQVSNVFCTKRFSSLGGR